MAYTVTLRKSAVKALTEISDPHYSAIKKAIYSLADNPRPQGYKKLKGRPGFRIRVGDSASFTMFSISIIKFLKTHY